MSFTIHTGVEDIMDNDRIIRELTDRVETIMNRREEQENTPEQSMMDLESLRNQLAQQDQLQDTDDFRQELLRQVEMSAVIDEVSPVKRHFFNIIMNQVRAIQKRYPKRFLCGSIALMLYGVMDKRDGGDLDFVAYEKKIIPNEHLSLKCSSPHNHCLFLGSYVKKGGKIDGVRLQDLDQIIYWKKSYGRKKDIKDLEKYFSNQFIKKDEFEIKE